MGRRSIFDMIQVTRTVMRNGMDSATNRKLGEAGSGGAFAALGTGGWTLCPMILTQNAMAAKMTMKMSRLPGAETILADENLAQSRGPCGREWFGWWQHWVPIQGASACVAKSLS